MNDYFDTLETRAPEVREKALLAALPAQVSHARANAAYFSQVLGDVDPARGRDLLAPLCWDGLGATDRAADRAGHGRDRVGVPPVVDRAEHRVQHGTDLSGVRHPNRVADSHLVGAHLQEPATQVCHTVGRHVTVVWAAERGGEIRAHAHAA